MISEPPPVIALDLIAESRRESINKEHVSHIDSSGKKTLILSHLGPSTPRHHPLESEPTNGGYRSTITALIPRYKSKDPHKISVKKESL